MEYDNSEKKYLKENAGYGVIDRAEISDTAIWFENIHRVFEKYGIARAAWTYKDIDFGSCGEHYSQQL